MRRREFLKQAAVTAATVATSSQLKAKTPANPIARRTLGRTGEQLSIIAFGGIVVMNESTGESSNIVAEAVGSGDQLLRCCSPSYGNAQGAAGARTGAAIARIAFWRARQRAGQMTIRASNWKSSLRLLKTDHVDLYQFHALTKMAELDKVLGPGGAMETMEAAKKEGKIRYIGFSVHSAETAVAAMDRYNFRYDSVSAELCAVYAGGIRAAGRF